jgi:hypothetical protein
VLCLIGQLKAQFEARSRPGMTQLNCRTRLTRPNVWVVPEPQVKLMGRLSMTYLTKTHRSPLNIDLIFN